MITTSVRNKESATSSRIKPAVMTKSSPDPETTPDTSLVLPHSMLSTKIKQAKNFKTPRRKSIGEATVTQPLTSPYTSTINQATINHVLSRAYNPKFNYPLAVFPKTTNSTAGWIPFLNLVKRKLDYEQGKKLIVGSVKKENLRHTVHHQDRTN